MADNDNAFTPAWQTTTMTMPSPQHGADDDDGNATPMANAMAKTMMTTPPTMTMTAPYHLHSTFTLSHQPPQHAHSDDGDNI